MNESVFWIMNILYGDCDLTLDQYNELLAAELNERINFAWQDEEFA